MVLLLEVLLVLLDLLLDLFEITQARQWVEDLGQTTRRTFIGHCLLLAADLPTQFQRRVVERDISAKRKGENRALDYV